MHDDKSLLVEAHLMAAGEQDRIENGLVSQYAFQEHPTKT